MVRGALASQEVMGFLANALRKGFQQPRLADPRFADQERHLSVASCRALPRIVQKCQFATTSKDGTGSCRMSCRKPAIRCALPDNLPNRYRLAKTLDNVLADQRKFEKIGGEPMRQRADEHATRIRQCLQSSGQVGGVADDGFLSGRAYSSYAARHRQARGDSYPSLHRFSIRLF